MVQVDDAAGTPLRSNAGLCFRLAVPDGGDAGAGMEGVNGRAAADLPGSITNLGRYIVTCSNNRHQFFWFTDKRPGSDPGLVYVASDDAFHLGVLSSIIHIMWIRTVGGIAEGHPVYREDRCFAPFPFPETSSDLRSEIAELADQLEQHRKNAMAADDRVAMTAIYDVITKLRSTEVFTPEERMVHRIAAGRILREMHHDLDGLVARAYGWRWPMSKSDILNRLVELHDERVEEEKAGRVRWLRPDYQIPMFGTAVSAASAEVDLGGVSAEK